MLQVAGKGKILGYVDDNSNLWGKMLMGLPIFGPIEHLADLDADAVIVGIGENKARKRYYQWAQEKGYAMSNAIHPRAVIARDVSIGEGVVIFANAVVNSESSIGDNVILNTGCSVDHDCTIGNHVHIGPGAHLAGGVVVGEESLVGIGASILPNRRVGRLSTVGAGGVVIHDIPDRVIAIGIPAKSVKEHVE